MIAFTLSIPAPKSRKTGNRDTVAFRNKKAYNRKPKHKNKEIP